MKIKLIHRIAIIFVWLIASTWRIDIRGKMPTNNSIVVFWHGKMLPGWYIFRKMNPLGVVSPSKDGEILSNILIRWNYSLLRGSSNDNGKQVLESIVENAKNRCVIMTPDGPKGPIFRMKPGAVVAAQRSNAKLILCRIDIKSKKIFTKSWDQFEFPIPFSKILIDLSEPISIAGDMTRDQISALISELEERLK